MQEVGRTSRFKVGTALRIAMAVLAFCAGSAYAQIGGKGAIEGTVKDASGAVVAGATITATDVGTNLSQTTTTTGSGYYTISPLSPGKYNVTANAKGFQKLTQQNVTIDALQVLGLNLTLAIGASTETMVVTDAPPQLETTNATLGATMENKTYTALPLEMNGGPRDPTSFVYLMPGVTQGGVSGIFNGSGSQGRLDEIYVDGVPITRISIQGDPRNVSSDISVEAVDQFQVETSGVPVEYQGAGMQNYVVKSGSNNFHGAIFEYFRNTALDTWGFFAPAVINPATGKATKPVEHQNEYGLTLGGPIIRNKVFFFGSYDGYRYNRAGNPGYYSIPTLAERQGDFSALLAQQKVPIYDPATTACSGKACTRQQFDYQGRLNVMDPARITSQSQFLQSFLPAPTNSGLTNNYLGQIPTNTFSWDTTDKIDADLTPKQRISLIVAAGKSGVLGYLSKGSQVPLPYTDGQSYAPKSKDIIFEHNYLITDHLVNQFKYGFFRYYDIVGNPSYNPQYGLNAAGFTGLPAGQVADSFPYVKFGGPDAPTVWDGGKSYEETTNTFDLLDNLQWSRGKHSFTFGFMKQWLQDNNTFYSTGSAPLLLQMSNDETAGYNNGTLLTKTGNSYASLLLGAVNEAQLQQYAVQEVGARIRPLSIYGQDDYRVSENLTLNLGLRWDLFPPFQESRNRFSFLNTTAINPAVGIPGALEFAGSGPVSCNCSTPVKTWYKNFGPRIGFAYSATPKTVVRGAFAMIYSHGTGILNASRLGTGQLGFSANVEPKSASNSGIPAFYLNDGFPAYQAPPFISATYGTGYSTTIKTSPASVAYGDTYLGGRAPYVVDWNLGIERQLTQNMAIQVNYAGSQGHFLPTNGSGARGIYNDQLDPKYYALGSLLNENASASSIAKADAIIPGIALPYPTYKGKLVEMLRPFPQYSGVGDTYGNIVNSAYNALQISLKQRTYKGLDFMLNYTYSKEIDDGGTFRSGYLSNRVERGLGTADQPQSIAGTAVYQIPFAPENFIAKAIASGWTVSGIYRYYSGNPLTIVASGCNTPEAGTCMPNYTPGYGHSPRRNGSWGKGLVAGQVSPSYIDAAAFQDPAPYTFGNSARTAALNLWNPSGYNLDMSLRRTFPIFERTKLQFEADAFNVTNKVVFGGIGQNIDSSNFGQVSKQQNLSRDIQLAARIEF